ncbi:TraX family protein [uncultured Clostridium sp.]|uniref:TraX family protein n=1 Tax=uncultured Clostridium sp. TaxID=59620 RepID=UPI002632FBEF|nr:TraX family protein [uncultured Clostridium sp.]
MDRFKIKVIIAIFFILGSIAKFIPQAPFILNYFGILVMPVAVFLVVDGYYHTKSVKNYVKRLMICGEAMLIGNFLISLIFMPSIIGRVPYNEISEKGYLCLIAMIIIGIVFLVLNIMDKCLSDKGVIFFIFIMAIGTLISLNVINEKIIIPNDNLFISLAGILVLIKTLDEGRENKSNKMAVKVLIILAVCMCTETLIIGPIFAIILFMFKGNKRMITTGLFVLSGILIPGFSIKELLMYPKWMMFFGIIFILLYNGEEGIKIKKPFYYIYPLAVWIPFAIGSIVR